MSDGSDRTDRDPAAVHPWIDGPEGRRGTSDRNSGPDSTPNPKPGPEPEPGTEPRLDGLDGSDGSGGRGPADPDVPTPIRYLGRGGEYLAAASVLLAVCGVAAIALGVQPYGSVATVAAIAGGSVAMVAGMAFQAYVSDAVPSR